LGNKHSWAGYSKQNISKIEKTGIYAFVRHPLYTGIYAACFGTFLFVIRRTVINPVVFYVYIITIGFVVAFLYLSSTKESVALKERFGEEYAQYEREVPAFFPRLFPKRGKDYDISVE
jgi:protein-S-isoprenylcysteine O-methyltransferase Ste14